MQSGSGGNESGRRLDRAAGPSATWIKRSEDEYGSRAPVRSCTDTERGRTVSRVVVTGATGMIGRGVCQALLARGDQPVALSRDPQRARAALPAGVEILPWTAPSNTPPPTEALAGSDAIVNLMGEPIAQRWNDEVKRRIRESRATATRNLVTGLRALGHVDRPTVLVSQSATGYYGATGDRELTEEAPVGRDFLADIAADWEAAAIEAADIVRVAVTRTGVVLSPSDGALAKMLPVFQAGVGGPVAGGRQYVPWVHLDDVVAALLFCVDDERASGVVNLTAPRPVDNKEFSHALGRALHRPAFLPVPGFALQLLYGEMSEIVTTGQRAIPSRLTGLGFDFRYREIQPALKDVLATGRKPQA